MLKTAKNFVTDGGNGWFAIFGQTGCGKTHLCSVVYMFWTAEVRKLKPKATGSTYDKDFDQFCKAEALYFDDLFKGKVTEADVQICGDLLNCCYNKS